MANFLFTIFNERRACSPRDTRQQIIRFDRVRGRILLRVAYMYV